MPLAIAAIVVTAISTAYSAYSAVDAAGDAKDASKKQADQERQLAGEQAKLVTEQGTRLKGEQRAALAASGVDLTNGGGGAIMKDTDRLVEQDALSILRGGGNQALRTEEQGNRTAKNYYSQAVTTSLNGLSSMLSQGSKMSSASQPAPDVAAYKPDYGYTAGGSNSGNYSSLLSGSYASSGNSTGNYNLLRSRGQ